MNICYNFDGNSTIKLIRTILIFKSMTAHLKIFPLGDNALTVEFGNVISFRLNNLAINLSSYFEKNPFPGIVELVPAYTSVTIFYDAFAVRKNYGGFNTAFAAVKNLVEDALLNLTTENEAINRVTEIPLIIDENSAMDLEFVALHNHLTMEEVIKIFTAKTYRVYMLGFLPGFAYMGEVDESIATPRKPSPRLKVPKGSVGIAGRQTGIYPLESPGGWQIIGRTDFELFTPDNNNPCAFQAGDLVNFYDANR